MSELDKFAEPVFVPDAPFPAREEFSCVEAAICLSMQRLGRKLTAEEREKIVASYIDDQPQMLYYDLSGLVLWLSHDDPRLAGKLERCPVATMDATTP
jgi:hypothetical protein